MSIFIAGHKGMVGQAVVRIGKTKNKNVHSQNRSDLDLTNQGAVTRYLKSTNTGTVILAAAKVGGIYANMSQKVKFLTENLAIQNSVILAARDAGVTKLIFLGSSCIYPKNATQPILEDSLLTGPLEVTNDAYALAKISGVKLCDYIREDTGLDYFSLMPTNLYGPGDNFDPQESHVPAALMRRIHEAKMENQSTVTIWGTGSPMREFMHVDDLADAIWFAEGNPPKENVINVGFGSEISIRDFAQKMCQIVGYGGELEFDTSKPDGTPRKLLNSEKLFGMGWRPKISLESGLESTYSWFLENLELRAVRGYVK